MCTHTCVHGVCLCVYMVCVRVRVWMSVHCAHTCVHGALCTACARMCMCVHVLGCTHVCTCMRGCVCACAEVCPPLLWFPECPCKSDPCSQAWTVVRLTPLQTPAPLPGPPRAKLSHRGPRPPCQGNTTNTFLTEFNNMVL